MHEIRILDLDAGRLMMEEGIVKAAVRQSKIKARVTMMADNLAIARQGLMSAVPVLEFDGRIISQGKPLVLAEVKMLLAGLE